MKDLNRICTTPGFNYPYIHNNILTAHLPLDERIKKYAAFSDDAANGQAGQTMLQSIYAHNSTTMLGATYFGAVGVDDPLFKDVNPGKAYEIGYFTDFNHPREGIATEALYYTVKKAMENGWDVQQLHASIQPNREYSIKIAQKFGLELVEEIPAGDPSVKYTDETGQRAARNIYRTPQEWSLPNLGL